VSATSFFLEAFHAPKDGIAVDLALVTRPAPGASPARFAPVVAFRRAVHARLVAA
jgi:hypothetical protein